MAHLRALLRLALSDGQYDPQPASLTLHRT
jgi:hypothetical protein